MHWLAVYHEVVERYVVAAEPVAPGAGVARGAEDAQVVQAGIAAALTVEPGGEALDPVQHVLEPHDRGDRDVPGQGKPGGDERHRRALLGGPLLVQGKPAVIGRRVATPPAPPVFAARFDGGGGC